MFRVRGTNITELLFIVYDRWGEEVYRTEDPEHQGWDGTFQGQRIHAGFLRLVPAGPLRQWADF